MAHRRKLIHAEALTDDYKGNTKDLNSGSNQCREELGTLRRPKDITVHQLPSSLLQCVILHTQQASRVYSAHIAVHQLPSSLIQCVILHAQ